MESIDDWIGQLRMPGVQKFEPGNWIEAKKCRPSESIKMDKSDLPLWNQLTISLVAILSMLAWSTSDRLSPVFITLSLGGGEDGVGVGVWQSQIWIWMVIFIISLVK